MGVDVQLAMVLYVDKKNIERCAVDRTVAINQIEGTLPQLSCRPIRSRFQRIPKRTKNQRGWNKPFQSTLAYRSKDVMQIEESLANGHHID